MSTAKSIVFIIPPSGFLLDERVFPSLGVLKVAAAARAAGHTVRVIDLSGITNDLNAELDQQLDGESPDAIGITATMPQMPAAAGIATHLRQITPHARLILGGPHPTLLHASVKQHVARAVAPFNQLLAMFDAVVCGDGERALFDALHVNGLIDADNPNSIRFLSPAALDAAPLPARDLIDLDSYRYAINGHKTVSLIAQLGCPFGCNFCGGRSSPFLRRVRLRSTASVVEEMRHLYTTYGYTGFMFLDDELNVNKSFAELLHAIIDLQHVLGVTFRLRGLLKSELVTREMADSMAAAGFDNVLIGFESGDPRMLLNMNKHATREDNTRCVETLHAAGIKVKALMSLGHPGETMATAAATQDWLLTVRPDDFDVTIITVYPGTPYYDQAVPNGDGTFLYTATNGDRLYQLPVDHLTDVNFYKGAVGAYRAFVWTDQASDVQLVEWRDTIEQTVRQKLHIPYPTSTAALHYEHSMGSR